MIASRLFTRSFSRAAAKHKLAIVDPRTYLSDPIHIKDYIAVEVSKPIAESIAKGGMKEELHEDEEPGNSWYAGKRDEIHSYGFEGQIPVQSGYVAVVDQSSMPAAGKESSDKRNVTWDAIKSGIEAALKKSPVGAQLTNVGPFLSVGRIISCPTVSVYTKSDGSAMALIADAPQAED